MKLLAIDFSTERRSVSVAEGCRVLATRSVHDRRVGALGLIESALADAGVVRREIGCVAVGLGPGSYTGIRSAIAIAQGWQLGCGIRLCGVSSVDVLAGTIESDGEFMVAVDAQRGEFYTATYRRRGPEVATISGLRIVGREKLLAIAGDDKPIIGPDAGQFGALGSEAYPDAAVLAVLASRNPSSVDGAGLEPVYLRPVEFRKAPPARIID